MPEIPGGVVSLPTSTRGGVSKVIPAARLTFRRLAHGAQPFSRLAPWACARIRAVALLTYRNLSTLAQLDGYGARTTHALSDYPGALSRERVDWYLHLREPTRSDTRTEYRSKYDA